MMKWKFSIHQQDRRLVFIFFVLWVVSLLLSSLFYLYGPPFIPLWYSLAVETDQIAPKIFIWVFPVISALILIVSLWNGRCTTMEHERYIARLSLLSGLVLMALLLISQFRILKIVL